MKDESKKPSEALGHEGSASDAFGRDGIAGDRDGSGRSGKPDMPARDVIVWERDAQTQDGNERSARPADGESTVRAVPLGTGTAGAKPPVIIIVSSGFGAVSRPAAPVRLSGARIDGGLRMAA